LAKIAVELERALARRAVNGEPGSQAPRLLARGAGWTVEDVICTSGPRDRPFEERHARISIAIVAAGSFQYCSTSGRALMTPGSLLLGNEGQCFECRHEHGMGDHCVSFGYTPDYFEDLAAGAGLSPDFPVLRLPPLHVMSPVVARAFRGLTGCVVAWEELGVELATQALQLAGGVSLGVTEATPSAVARVTRAVRAIDEQPAAGHKLENLARDARWSRYHFLRTFEQVMGVTPHQYLLRARLRDAALRLAEPVRILDVALDCGFGDVSNFNRTFRAEFGVSPRVFRAPRGPREE
jgi:AraC family transcriptional regulator